MAVDTTETNALRRRFVQGESELTEEAPAPHRVPRPRKGFVELLMSPLSFVVGDGEPEDPQVAARRFAHSLMRRYGENVTPHFEHLSFQDAVSTARTASKFLLVFLHSNIHDDADSFCRNELCTERMSAYLNNSDCIVSWAGCVQHAEGFNVSLSLGCATFPYLALLSCISRGVSVVEKITGNIEMREYVRATCKGLLNVVLVAKLPVDEIIDTLNAAVDRNNHVLATSRHVRQQQTEAQILREQQDREYQESLAADRRREQEAREEAEREEQEREQREAEARRLEDEKVREEEDVKAAIARKRARIADGPKARTPPPNANYKTAVIKFHLHNGTRLHHIFYAHDTLQTVRDFVDVEFYDRHIPIRNYELATNFPKKVYGPDLLDVTLAEAALAPQALVYVQDLDS